MMAPTCWYQWASTLPAFWHSGALNWRLSRYLLHQHCWGPSNRHAVGLSHDDVIKWKHFPRNWPFVRGIHRSPVNSPHKGQWRGALMFSLICVWINDWVNSCEAGDLRRYRAQFDVIVMQHYAHRCSGDYQRQTTSKCNVQFLMDNFFPYVFNRYSSFFHKLTFLKITGDVSPCMMAQKGISSATWLFKSPSTSFDRRRLIVKKILAHSTPCVEITSN